MRVERQEGFAVRMSSVDLSQSRSVDLVRDIVFRLGLGNSILASDGSDGLIKRSSTDL